MKQKNTPKKQSKRSFKSLSEINHYILTKECGEKEANRIMCEMKKFEKMGHPSKNKMPI